MTDTLEHRGPDDQGVWTDASVGLGLGHRRLSIQDLSTAGQQPMISASGRYVMVFNGEIYNFLEMRRELEQQGHRFRGHSDTEVLLEAIGEWGIEKTVSRSVGMFAFALWDIEQRRLTLARDRLGKKPLYYGWCGDAFLFGSELKALFVHPDFEPEIDRDALGLLVRYSWIPGPLSIFRKIRKLPAGTLLTISADRPGEPLSSETYWSARTIVEAGARQPFRGSLDDAVSVVDEVLRDAVEKRMIADVNLGGLLSGGVDSTLVVALMQSPSSRPVQTFTIGFQDPKYNEAEHARALAKYLGTEHTEFTVTPQETLDIVPELPSLYDEPLGDPSQIPTVAVARLARSKVKVVLSGDGGDELFAGYRRYATCINTWQSLARMPASLRGSVAKAIGAVDRKSWEILGSGAAERGQPLAKWKRMSARLERRTRSMAAMNPLDLFVQMRARCGDPGEFVVGAELAPNLMTDTSQWADVSDPLQAMTYLDMAGYLTDDILVKVDRATMSVGLEARNPILDHRLVEFAFSLPSEMRLGPQGGKIILKRLLARYVPKELTDRPKWGFGVPISTWMRGPLREWALSLIDQTRLHQEGFLHSEAVGRVWRQHQSGWRDQRELLWSILMFQAWYEAFRNNTRTPVLREAAA